MPKSVCKLWQKIGFGVFFVLQCVFLPLFSYIAHKKLMDGFPVISPEIYKNVPEICTMVGIIDLGYTSKTRHFLLFLFLSKSGFYGFNCMAPKHKSITSTANLFVFETSRRQVLQGMIGESLGQIFEDLTELYRFKTKVERPRSV